MTKMKRKEPKANPHLKAGFMEIVDNQLKENDLPETRETLARLISEGFSDESARMHIAAAVTVEVSNTLVHETPFNLARYVQNLKNLPNEPKS
jgi:hypothetical protein